MSRGALRLWVVGATLALGAAQSANAQGTPPGCSAATGTIIDTVSATPVLEGQEVFFRVGAAISDPNGCFTSGGFLVCTFPNGVEVQVAGFGVDTPDFPEIPQVQFGNPFIVTLDVPYIVDLDDATVGPNGNLILVAEVRWFGAVVLTPTPTTNNDSNEFPLLVSIPEITLDKQADVNLFCEGDPTEVTFDFQVGNPGDSSLSNVELTADACDPIFTGGDVNMNGTLDPDEFFLDLNANGEYDFPEPFTDADMNGVWDPAEVWTYQCSAVLTETTICEAVATGTAVQDNITIVVMDEASEPVNAEPVPQCAIEGPLELCPGSSGVEYTVEETSIPTIGDVTFAWTIEGDALFCDGGTTASGPMACVDAASICGSFLLRVVVTNAVPGTNVVCESECELSVDLVDDEAPALVGCPDQLELELECGQSIPDPADVTCVDNCDPDVPVDFSETTEGDNCEMVITRTWTCTDLCDNTDSCTQIITIRDTTDPVLIGCPPLGPIEIECGEDLPPAPNVTCEDACDPDVQVVFSGDVPSGDNCQTIITRTWTCTDRCGNSATCAQVFNIVDTTAPTLVGCPDPGPLELDCSDDLPEPADVTCVDACDPDVDVEFSETQSGDGCDLTITRTWTCTDRCGNTDSCVQVITVTDDTPPEIMCPPDAFLDCNDSTDPSNTGSATADDFCDDAPTVSFSDVVISQGSCPSDGLIQRTWTAVDACGNESSCVQSIAVLCPPGGLIGDFIWIDENGNGIQDDGETGIPGVVLQLFETCDDTVGAMPIQTTVTNLDGFYVFEDLCAGDYLIVIDPDSVPDGFVETTANQGGDDTVDSDCINGEICVTLPADDSIDLVNDCGFIPQDCEVICIVERIACPEPDCGPCDGQVDSLTLQFNGDATAYVEVEQHNDDIVFAGDVDPGGSFSFSGTSNSGTFGSKIKVYVDGQFNVEIHTSCSQPIGVGQIVGDFEILAGTSRHGGPLCPFEGDPDDGHGDDGHGDDGHGDAGGDDCCDNGKPVVLTMEYTGDDCSATSHSQDDNKVECDDYDDLNVSVYIIANDDEDADDDDNVWFAGTVLLGDTFDIDAANGGEDKLKNETHIHVFSSEGGSLLQHMEFHTSCSQPLYLGDQFGSAALVGCIGEDQLLSAATQGDARGGSGELSPGVFGTSYQFSSADDGHDDDGHEDDGHDDDGHNDDGHEDDGHEDDGHEDDGHADDGHADDGHGDVDCPDQVTVGWEVDGECDVVATIDIGCYIIPVVNGQIVTLDCDPVEEDGHGDDGHADDGHADDGHGDDGHEDYAYANDGHEDDGHADDGHEDDGHADDGHEDDGHEDDGHEDDGHADDGHADDGHGDGTPDPVCVWEYIGDELVIRSEMAVLTVVGLNGDDVADACEIDLCTFLASGEEVLVVGDDDGEDPGPEPVECPEDTNADGRVDIDDLVGVLTHWGPAPGGHECDVNGDERVDADDMVMVVVRWGTCE